MSLHNHEIENEVKSPKLNQLFILSKFVFTHPLVNNHTDANTVVNEICIKNNISPLSSP